MNLLRRFGYASLDSPLGIVLEQDLCQRETAEIDRAAGIVDAPFALNRCPWQILRLVCRSLAPGASDVGVTSYGECLITSLGGG